MGVYSLWLTVEKPDLCISTSTDTTLGWVALAPPHIHCAYASA